MKKKRIHDTMELEERIEILNRTMKIRKSILDKMLKILNSKNKFKE